MKKTYEVTSDDIESLENLTVVFDSYDGRTALVQEIYLYCDMLSDWLEVTMLMLPKEKFMERLIDVLEDHLLNLELESLNEEAV